MPSLDAQQMEHDVKLGGDKDGELGNSVWSGSELQQPAAIVLCQSSTEKGDFLF